jgi:hypothetical protein
MPADKIEKAEQRLRVVLKDRVVSKTSLNKLLGSLRHVATCVRAAAPFYQRVSSAQRNISRFAHGTVSSDVIEDLKWFSAIMHTARLNSIPLEQFVDRQDPNEHVFMDASDVGLCAILPSRKEFLQVRFSDSELQQIAQAKQGAGGDFGINVRELMSAVFAALVWGQCWSSPTSSHNPSHIHFWIDNRSAVASNNKRASPNTLGQLLLRLLALVEVQYNFYTSTAHIPGEFF